jgi:hypothetical protein
MQSPRGSNNKNSNENNNVQNDNRLFDSQNNAASGYCWGPTMYYYSGSYIQVEWTNQHGCGGMTEQDKVDCDLIIQYMCGKDVRDGTSKQTIEQETRNTIDPDTGEYVYGMHEPWENYRKCSRRKRNQGLFAANQNILNENVRATQTRQDANGNNDVYGFECPEERDYYPYWHPTPWKDIAVFTSNTARCPYYQTHSQNVEDKWHCESDNPVNDDSEEHNNAGDCGVDNWVKVDSWSKQSGGLIQAPECHQAGFNRDNHLGNGLGGYANTYRWVLPSWGEIDSFDIVEKRNLSNGETDIPVANCVLRLRYNISTLDYPGYDMDAGPESFVDFKFNGDNSPIKNDPYIEYGKPYGSDDEMWHLKLEMNPDQYARTFEDRSHLFYIRQRPLLLVGPIFNLMVRGKRGNIVQAYPGVEYDFTPNRLIVPQFANIHFQWTGCDTGQANQAGQGLDATDRSNIVPTMNGATNYPIKFDDFDMIGPAGSQQNQELAFLLGYINQYNGVQCDDVGQLNCCYTYEQVLSLGGNDDDIVQNCALLNAEGANYFDGGLQSMVKIGKWHYMSTRNNNFTNRSHKGTITVEPRLSPIALTATVAGVAGFAGASVAFGGIYYSSSHDGTCFTGLDQHA